MCHNPNAFTLEKMIRKTPQMQQHACTCGETGASGCSGSLFAITAFRPLIMIRGVE